MSLPEKLALVSAMAWVRRERLVTTEKSVDHKLGKVLNIGSTFGVFFLEIPSSGSLIPAGKDGHGANDGGVFFDGTYMAVCQV